jgi:hypothetical protein
MKKDILLLYNIDYIKIFYKSFKIIYKKNNKNNDIKWIILKEII